MFQLFKKHKEKYQKEPMYICFDLHHPISKFFLEATSIFYEISIPIYDPTQLLTSSLCSGENI